MSYYAYLDEGKWRGISTHPKTTACHGPEEIFEVSVREAEEDEENTHWGWYSNEDEKYHYVFTVRGGTEMCFAYGTKPEEERGRGKVVRLIVDKIKSIGHVDNPMRG